MEVSKQDVKRLIELNEENSFVNHSKYIFNRDDRIKGEVGLTEIILWKSGLWNRTNYPIFTFKFNSNNHLVDISDRINPMGKILNYVLCLPLSFLIITHLVEGDELVNIMLSLLFLVVMIVLVIVKRKIYIFEKKNQLDSIYEFLDMELEPKTKIKEWSLVKIITRLFMYPFCVGLILLSVILLFPNGKFIQGIFAIVIACTYLFSDIKILISKNN